MPFDRTVTWRQFAHQSIEMRVSVSENFKIWRWIGFLFFRIKKSSGGEGRCQSVRIGLVVTHLHDAGVIGDDAAQPFNLGAQRSIRMRCFIDHPPQWCALIRRQYFNAINKLPPCSDGLSLWAAGAGERTRLALHVGQGSPRTLSQSAIAVRPTIAPRNCVGSCPR